MTLKSLWVLNVKYNFIMGHGTEKDYKLHYHLCVRREGEEEEKMRTMATARMSRSEDSVDKVCRIGSFLQPLMVRGLNPVVRLVPLYLLSHQ